MARKILYRNKRTRETTPRHSTAMEWFRGKDNIDIIDAGTGKWLLDWTWGENAAQDTVQENVQDTAIKPFS